MRQTSIEAFAHSREYASTNRAIIINTMNEQKKPMTSEEISQISGLRYDQVWRRMSELENENKVKCTNNTGVNTSGRRAHKWELV